DRYDLTAGIHELVGIVWQQIQVEAVGRELRLVEVALSRADRDVSGRLLRQRQGAWIELHRKTGSGQAGGKPGLAGRGRVSDETVKPARQRAGERVRADLRVVHRVAAANHQSRVGLRVPREAQTRRDVPGRVGQRLEVVAQTGVERALIAHAEPSLHERR